jgi:Uma2 family endonuclease
VSTSPRRELSAEAYLALDVEAERKLEYVAGGAVAMAGASPRHNQIVANLLRVLSATLAPRGCFVAAADQRVRLGATGAYVYPDVVVSCAPQFEPPRPLSLVNPELVVEVLSRSTQEHDSLVKLAEYRAEPSVLEIVLVHTRERLVEHHKRVDGARWLITLVRSGEVELPGTRTTLAVSELYAGLDALPDDDAA